MALILEKPQEPSALCFEAEQGAEGNTKGNEGEREGNSEGHCGMDGKDRSIVAGVG
jgi:hypothetical protein